MKTANKCYQATTADAAAARRWFVVDATDQVLGRLAVRIANVLMGKHKPMYTPHIDTGDFVIVLNAGKIKTTGARKRQEVIYYRYTGYPSGLKKITMESMLARHPERVLREAVRRMLPKSALGARMLKKLRLFTGPTHEHQAQQPEPLPLS
jgi:large subunit ribosomal protein L13